MKYTSSYKPLVCMQTQSTCYKGTDKITVKGILWHSTGANNPNLKRYVQPSDTKPPEDTYDKAEWLEVLGTNTNKNDWNHITRQAGLNCWIGKLANGSVTTVQTMPWDYRPWGCGKGSKGSCNYGWIQFEICEDGLTDETYFKKVYEEACELTAYLCKMFNIDPKGTVTVNGVEIPTILCHADSHKLGFGSNHADVNHWFPKHGKSMATAREDVAAILEADKAATTTVKKIYRVRKSKSNAASQKGAFSDLANAKDCCQTAGAGYHVFDWDYNIVYSYTEPVVVTLSSIAVKTMPKKTEYTVGDKYDGAGLVVTATYSDKTSKTITGYEVSGFNSSKAGTITLNVSFEGKATTFTVTVKEPVIAVYDLDYPEKTKIVDREINRTNSDCVKAIKKILSNNDAFDIEIAKAFFKLAPIYGIDPMMAIAQSILETGWFKYAGSAVTADQHNYCGLGVTVTGAKGAAFSSIEDGVTAQLQHLFAYGCKDDLPTDDKVLDTRFSLVTRGIAQYWQQLAGRWACPGYDNNKYAIPAEAMAAEDTYGQRIRNIYNQLLAMVVTDEEVEEYFGKDIPIEEDIPEENDPGTKESTTDEKPNEPEDTKQTEDDKSTKLAKLIFDIIRKLIQMFADAFGKK